MASTNTSPLSKKNLILKCGERKMLMHRLSTYESTITLARLELHLSPIKQYLLMVDMADIEPGSTHGFVQLSRTAWDLVGDCQRTPVLEIREDSGYNGEPQGEEAALRWRDFQESEATLARELGPGLPASAPAASANPKEANAAPKDTKKAAPSVKADGLTSVLKVASSGAKNPLPVRTDGKIEISICRGDSSEVSKFLAKPSSSVEKVLKGWYNLGENRSKTWRMEFKGKPITAFDQTMGELGVNCGDKIYAWEEKSDAKDSVLFNITWSPLSGKAGTLGFKVQKDTRFQTVIDAWCDVKGHREEDWIFEIDGEDLIWSDGDTVEDLGIEKGDEILAIRDD